MTQNLFEPSLAGRLSPFVGRKKELEKVVDLIQDAGTRLVTIVGPGGIGKSRLAVEAAAQVEGRFEQEVTFVPLADLNQASEVLPALAKVLGVQVAPGGSMQQAVVEHLAGQERLVVFDNFEHLLEAAGLVYDLLRGAGRVKVVVTAREKLGLRDETVLHLRGLEAPAGDGEGAEGYEAVGLFLQKARQACPGFELNEENSPAVVEICRKVGGNPLGILLAAAWVEHFSAGEIEAQIGESLDFLAHEWRDGEPRHAGLRAVFDSSFRRLEEGDQAVLRRLAIFRGGFDLAAAQTVGGADLRTLIRLVDKSLLAREAGTGRYGLHEVLRQYAGEALTASGEREAVSLAHAGYFRGFVAARERRMIGPGQAAALDELQRDFENIRQALGEWIERRDYEAVREMLPGLYAFCDMRSRFYEGEAMFWEASAGLAPREGAAVNPGWGLALLSWYDLRAYRRAFEAGEGIAERAEVCLKAAREAGDEQATAACLVLLGAIAEDGRDYGGAIGRYGEAMRIYPGLDEVYWVNMRIGLCYQAAGRYAEAIGAYQVSLRRGRESGERVKAGWALVNIGDTLLLQKKVGEAQGYLDEAEALFEAVGTRFGRLWAHHSLGRAALELGERERAAGHVEAAERLAREIHSGTWARKVKELRERLERGAEARGGAFSERELEVLRLLKSQLSGPEIARELVISLNTVRYHTKNIYQKLGVRTRLEAIERARELGV